MMNHWIISSRAAWSVAIASSLIAGCARNVRDRPFEVPNGDLQGELNRTITMLEARWLALSVQKHLKDGNCSGMTIGEAIDFGRKLDTAYSPPTQTFEQVRGLRFGDLQPNDDVVKLTPFVTFNEYFSFYVAVQYRLSKGDTAAVHAMTLGQLLDDGKENAARYRRETLLKGGGGNEGE